MRSVPNGIGPKGIQTTFLTGVCTGSDPELLALTWDWIHLDFMNFKQPFGKFFVSFSIRFFEILEFNRLFVSSLISFFEMSAKTFQFYLSRFPIRTSLDPISLAYTRPLRNWIQMGTVSKVISFGYGEQIQMGSDPPGPV